MSGSLLQMKFERLRSLSLWLLGILGCVCKWDPAVCPKALVFAACLVPCFMALHQIIKYGRVINNFFSLWYGPFFVLICFSLLYTANNIDANDIVRRCALCFVIGFSASQLSHSPYDLKKIMEGLVVGACVTMLVTLKVESSLIGRGRLGDITCGAATAYSGMLLVGIISLFVLNGIKKSRIYTAVELFLLAGIVLSGSRMPLLIAGLCFCFLKLLETGLTLKMFGNIIKIIAIVGCVGYAVMTNPVLYDVAGKRFESMLYSVEHGIDKENDSSLNERREMKVEALKLWSSSPVFGRGVNSFWVLSPIRNGRASSHCGYTEILCSFGALGLLLFYWPFFKPIKNHLGVKKNMATYLAFVLVVYLVMEWQGGYFDSCAHVLFLFILFQYIRFLNKEKEMQRRELLVGEFE